MKYLCVLACLVVVAYAIPPEVLEKFKEKMLKLGAECKTELDASDDDIAPMLKHERPNTEKGKCFIACMNKKMDFQDKSGKIDKEGTYAMVEKIKAVDEDMYTKFKTVADNCLAEVTDADNECETATNMFVCVKREEKAAGIEHMDFSS